MKFVIQRVTQASVLINNKDTESINQGLVVLVAIHKEDTIEDALKYIPKILKLRIFADDIKPINRSVKDINGEVMLISQFTLYGDCKGQNRPSFMESAKPDKAKEIYEAFVQEFKKQWVKTKTGRFAADMQLSLTNDGPVTIVI